MSYYIVAGCHFTWGIGAFFFFSVLFLSGVVAIGGGLVCTVVEKWLIDFS